MPVDHLGHDRSGNRPAIQMGFRKICGIMLGVCLICPCLVWAQFQGRPAGHQSFIPISVKGPGIYRMGQMQINIRTKTLIFPARIGSDSGNLSYLMVSGQSGLNPSLLVTDFTPYDFHIAFSLLGFIPPSPSDNPSPDPGIAVDILIMHRKENLTQKQGPGDFLFNGKRTGPLKWVFTGSNILHAPSGKLHGIIALGHDPNALVQPETLGNQKENWSVNEKGALPRGTGVAVRLQLKSSN